MTVTTTPNIEGKKIVDYRGIVTGEAIMGANTPSQPLPSMRLRAYRQ